MNILKSSPNKIILFVLFLLVIVTGAICIHRSNKGSNDFDTFYYAGQAVWAGEGIYYIGEYYEENPKIGPFLYPPFAACFFSIFALLPLSVAAFLWNFLNCLLFLGSLHLIYRLVIPDILHSSDPHDRSLPNLWKGIPRLNKIFVVAICLILFLDNITMAQVNILVGFLCLLALYLWKREWKLVAGIMIAVATFIKVAPALFCLYFLLKRQWRVLIGFVMGSFLCIFIIPTLLFGFNTNRLYHQQFLGRTIKPIVTEALTLLNKNVPDHLHRKPGDEIHFDSMVERIRHNRLTGQLVKKNQALEASLTRLLLKDRKKMSYGAHPIYVARDYENLPVLFGGLSQEKLVWLIRIIQMSIGLTLVFFWRSRKYQMSG